MLKSCQYCGRIHDSKHTCPEKAQVISIRQQQRSASNKKIYDFRRSPKWTIKSQNIRQRDNYCCQLCIRGLHEPSRQFETDDISVHHIIPIAEDWDKRLDDYNLISLCKHHHDMAEQGEVGRDELLSITQKQEKSDNAPPIG